MQRTRRELLRSFSLFGGAVLVSRGLAACGLAREEGESLGASEDDLVTCARPVISANHGHAVAVPPSDIQAGVTRTYSIQGQSGHDHTITVTAAHFAELANGRTITVVSTNDFGHTHAVTVSCSVVARDAGADGDAAFDGDADAAASDAGGDGGSPDAASPGACVGGALATAISANHGHALTVPRADVLAGVAKTYAITGSSSHPHEVTLGANHFADLRRGIEIVVTSTSDFGHTHAVTVACA